MLPLRQAILEAHRIGADAVQIDARRDIAPSELSATGLRQLRKMLDDSHLRVASVRFQTRRGYDNPDDLSRRIDATKQAMQFAYRIGADLVINQIGTVPEETADPRYELLRSVMGDLGKFGTHVGAFLAAETGTESGPTLAKLLDAEENAFVAVAMNAGKMIVNRFAVEAAIEALGARTRCVVAMDGVVDLAAGRGIHVPVGEGIADFPAIMAKLEDHSFDGYFIVGDEDPDANSRRLAAEAIEYLRNL